MAEIKLPKLKSVNVEKKLYRKKNKILLLSDDLRMSSGVGTMSREIVLNTIDKYDWVQIGGAIKHPEEGKAFDISDDIRKESGVLDSYLKIYPTSGYGNPELLKQIMEIEKPDAILHYTDPRFWQWLYNMEHEIRQHIPIFYYNIWDDWPAPQYNENYYESCDLIMNISKQTHAIVQEVCQNKPRTEWDSTYVPHGINEDSFYPVTDNEELTELKKFKNQLLGNRPNDFVLLYVNRNIRRKMVGDSLLAFKEFVNQLPEEKRDRVTYVMHTQPVDENGTDLPKLIEHLMPEVNVVFSHQKLDNKHMNFLYNIADVTMNLASNEGFGLGTCESLMAGTPIIVNVTGGLQDQCGFKLRGEYINYRSYGAIKSLHDWRLWEHNEELTWGEWAKPVWPRSRALMGSVPTPYIFDDRCDWVDAANRLKEWYDMDKEERTRCGVKGHYFVKSDDANMSARAMGGLFIEHMETAFDKWTPRKKINVYKVEV